MRCPRTTSALPDGQVIVYRDGIAAVWHEGLLHYQRELSDAERRVVRAMALGLEKMPAADYTDLQMFAAFFLLGGNAFAVLRNRADADIANSFGVPLDLVRLRRRLPEPSQPF